MARYHCPFCTNGFVTARSVYGSTSASANAAPCDEVLSTWFYCRRCAYAWTERATQASTCASVEPLLSELREEGARD